MQKKIIIRRIKQNLKINKRNITLYVYMSWLLNICCTRLLMFIKRLTLDDIMVEDNATQTRIGDGSCHVIDEPKSFN